MAENDHSVEPFSRHGPYSAFRVGIGPRRSDRRLDHPDVLRAEHFVEAGADLGSSTADEELDGPTTVHKTIHQLAGDLVIKAPVGWSVTPRTRTSRVASPITKSCSSDTVSTVKKSMASTPWAWARKNSE